MYVAALVDYDVHVVMISKVVRTRFCQHSRHKVFSHVQQGFVFLDGDLSDPGSRDIGHGSDPAYDFPGIDAVGSPFRQT